jgi:membrane protein YdbS with pleckstrin-like domain
MASLDLPIRAAFNPLYKPYLLITIAFTLFASLIGIPFAIVWLLGAGQWWCKHYFEKLDCELTDDALRFRKGIIFQTEKTIPLENIQDVAFVEGPLLRQFNLSRLDFVTAGASSGQLASMSLTAVIDAHLLRDQILVAREEKRKRLIGVISQPTGASGGDEVLATLKRIEVQLERIVGRLEK